MLRKVRRLLQQLGGRSCLRSHSVWVDVVLVLMFITLFITVYHDQSERVLQRHTRAIEIMGADGKMMLVSDGDSDWKEGDDRQHQQQHQPPSGEVNEKAVYRNISEMAAVVGDAMILKSIQRILADIPQSFGSACDNAFYPDSAQLETTLIVVFYDHQLYDLKVTLSSVLVNTPDGLIDEILVVDDGSTDPKVIRDTLIYIGHISKAKLIRNDERQGESASRMRAVKLARSNNIVFMSTTVVVSPGWLEPIVDYLYRHHSCIVIPHLDKVFEPYKYETLARTWVGQFSWSLTVHMQRNSQEENGNLMIGVNSPVFKSDIFATSRFYLDKFGFYDPALLDSGAEHIELALRTWLCSGTVRVIRCSHVGVLNMADSSPVDDAFGTWRVAQLWMSDHVALVAQLSGLHYNPTAEDIDAVEDRRLQLNSTGQCNKNIDWYMRNLANNVHLPSKNAKTVGFLKVNNGFCAHVVNDTRIEMGSCIPGKFHDKAKDMTFEHTDSGKIKVKGQCLSVIQSFVLVLPCSTMVNTHQIWLRKADSTVRSKIDGLCLMHVTDPALKKLGIIMQTLMAQKCTKDKSSDKTFSGFDFVAPE